MTRPYFIGVDGGGTKTEFLLIDRGATVMARARTGTTYHVQVGVAGVQRALSDGIATLLAQAHVARDTIGYALIGLPALGEDSIVDPQLHAACEALLGHDRFRCENDMVCGWAGSLGGEDGINLVAGTGSIGYGRHGDLDARIGGWGETFSDEGSAYWIAIRGLNAFTRMSDGRLPVGPLHAVVVAALDLKTDLDVCGRLLGADGPGRDGIAALAPLVAEAADKGDRVCADILLQAADELVSMARTLRGRLDYAGDDICPISWSGGVLANVEATRTAFLRGLAASGGFETVTPRYSPALGAALYARKLSETVDAAHS